MRNSSKEPPTSAVEPDAHLGDLGLASRPRESERNRVGAALFEFYLGTLLRHGLCNWDPHPGNYIFLPGSQVAMLDYGSTRGFDAGLVNRLCSLTFAIQDDDGKRCAEGLGTRLELGS